MMKTLILAGGFGVRLKEIIHGRPKVMAPVGDKPFLEHLLLLLRKKGLTDIVLAVGYLAPYVKDYFGDGSRWGVSIQYSEDRRPLGTAGTIKHAASFFDRSFIVVNGDTYVDFDPEELTALHKKRHAIVTQVVTKHNHGHGGVAEIDKESRIVQFHSVIENPERHAQLWFSAGVYIIDPEIFSFIKAGFRSSLEHDVFPMLLAKKRLFAHKIATDYVDIGTPEYYRQAKALLLVEGVG